MSRSTLFTRLTQGVDWSWVQERHRQTLPLDLGSQVMSWRGGDRQHHKQGRSTARFRFEGPNGCLSVYVKRHERLPWVSRVLNLIRPGGDSTPGVLEWRHLERVRALGISVPEVVAVGERIGPWGRLQSYILVEELGGFQELHEAIPELAATLDRASFQRFKRAMIRDLVQIVAKLHRFGFFHKDLYLCHFLLERSSRSAEEPRLALIDLHRLGQHAWFPQRWRWKDLGQLLFSSYGVDGIDDRDRLRFWTLYRKRLGLRAPRWQMRAIRRKASRYLSHNR